MSSFLRFGLAATVAISCGLALPIACGSSADNPPGSDGGGAGQGGGGGGNTGGLGAGGSGGIVIDTGAEDVFDPDSGCGLITEQAVNKPLELYIMMDKSSSMAGPQWDSATKGLIAFLNDTNSNGIYVGLKFFPRKPDTTEVCDQKAYAIPDAPFGQLPQNASTLVSAITSEMPNGLSTPIWPALGGAILKGIEIAQNNPGHTSAVLLVTDGVPQGPAPQCSGVDPTSTAEIQKLAATGATFNPPVLTYVIGLPGVDQSFANAVAASGGTASAILVSVTNVEKEFKDALAKVRGQALPCEFDIPPKVVNGDVQYDKVNVYLTPGSGATTLVLQTPDCNQAAGWYYDPAKTKIILCPSICASLKQDFNAKVDIQLGCPTQVVK